MNEKQKKITIGIVFFLLVAVIFTQSIVDNIALRRANTALDTLGTDLADAQQRLVASRTEIREGRATIIECRDSIRRVNDGLERQSTELKDIIENLRQVRAEVENMENALDKFYNKYGDCIDYTYISGGEVE